MMKKTIAALTLAIFSTIGCESGSNTGQNSNPELGQALSDGSIFGLWLIDQEDDSATHYFEITTDSLSFYSEDTTENCYSFSPYPLTKLGATTYSIEGGESFELIANGDTLQVIDEDTQNSNGDSNATIVREYTRVINLASQDLNLCT